MNQYHKDTKIILLPSDSDMKFNPDNTISKFTINLDQTYVFSSDYEVALMEIIYPSSIRNITKKLRYKLMFKNETIKKSIGAYVFEAGIYDEDLIYHKIHDTIEQLNVERIRNSIKSLLMKVNKSDNIEVNQLEFPKFLRNSSSKIEIRCGYGKYKRNDTEETFELYIQFDDYLHQLLGFTGDPSICEDKFADNIFDIAGQTHLIYIYSDIVEPITVGGKSIPLLQVITVDPPTFQTKANLQTLNRIPFESPIFLPLSRRIIDSITIECRDDVGDLVQFETGKIVVTLLIRKIKK